ncbi:hypothetical protein J6590_105117, partial [Homalodisca vitripennis]
MHYIQNCELLYKNKVEYKEGERRHGRYHINNTINCVSIPATCSEDPESLQRIETRMEEDATDNGKAT